MVRCFDGYAETVLRFRGVGRVLLAQQLAFQPIYLSLTKTDSVFICDGQRFRQSM
jgi:hypothetical protein